MNRNRYITSIILSLSMCFLLYSCNIDQNPISGSSDRTVKIETKWLCDNISSDKISILSIKEYDKYSNLTKWIEYYQNGSMASEANYTYDNSTTEINKSYFNQNGDLDSTRISSLVKDNYGQVVEKTVSDNDGNELVVHTYDYDLSGNLISRTDKKSTGEVQLQIKYEYAFNNNGNIIARIENPSSDGSFQKKDSLIYYASRNKVERLTFDSNDEIQSKHTYIYDKYGNISEEIHANENGEVFERYKYDYVYF